jgi:hypothetical protein
LHKMVQGLHRTSPHPAIYLKPSLDSYNS